MHARIHTYIHMYIHIYVVCVRVCVIWLYIHIHFSIWELFHLFYIPVCRNKKEKASMIISVEILSRYIYHLWSSNSVVILLRVDRCPVTFPMKWTLLVVPAVFILTNFNPNCFQLPHIRKCNRLEIANIFLEMPTESITAENTTGLYI